MRTLLHTHLVKYQRPLKKVSSIQCDVSRRRLVFYGSIVATCSLAKLADSLEVSGLDAHFKLGNCQFGV